MARRAAQRVRRLLAAASLFALGGAVGAYVFADTKPRSVLALGRCERTCYGRNQLIGLAASVGIARVPSAVPSVVLETDKSIALRHPRPEARIHIVVVPKKDIRDAGDVTEQDAPYVEDAFAVMAELIRRHKLHNYRIITNGPGFQDVSYLHFHLRAD